MDEKKYNENINWTKYLLFGILMFSSTMSFVAIFHVKIWYISLFICALYFLRVGEFTIPKSIFLAFISIILFASLINLNEFGIKRDFYNCILGIGLVCISYTLVIELKIDKIEYILKWVAVLNALFVGINTLSQIEAIKEYLVYRKLDHPVLNTLSVGGTNLDATWLSVYCAVFYKSKYKWIFMLYSIAINTIYAARVGYLINIFLICFFLYQDRKTLKKHIIKIIIGFAMFIPMIVNSVAFNMAISRFSGIGTSSDEGGMHRLLMWIAVPKVICEYPLGVGMGNTIIALNKVTGKIYRDGNYHNLVLEYFGTAGILGGILFLIMLVFFAVSFIKMRNKMDSITLMLACYLVAGMVQFSGDESIMFLLVGAFLGIQQIKRNIYMRE